MDVTKKMPADDEITVAAQYQDGFVADNYLAERLRFSWQNLLHQKQVAAINRVLESFLPLKVLELAPGPARLSVNLKGVKHGFMVENSEEMIVIALKRLRDSGLDRVWEIIHGNAFNLDRLIEASSCDFCFTFRFIRHFHLNDRVRLYRLIRERLTSRGFLMLDVVNEFTRAKIDARQRGKLNQKLCIYDASYSESNFKKELDSNGFKVIMMEPVINYFSLQSWLSYKFDDVFRRVTMTAVSFLEKIPSRHSLEWIALCQKI
jgi:hypothetical protein